jgi:MFS family permease
LSHNTTLHPIRAVKSAFAIIRADRALRFVFLTIALIGVMVASGYVLLVVSVQTVLANGTKGVGLLGGVTAAGMIVGSLAIGTVGTRFDKGTIILGSMALLGLAMAAGAYFYTFAALLPIGLVAGALLAPVMVSQDTMIHEAAPPESRAKIFSTRELVLGGAFVLTAWTVGGTVALADRAGWEAPYRATLGVCGILFALVAAGAALAHVRGKRRYHVRSSLTE